MEPKFHAGEVAQIKTTGEIVTINTVSPGMNQFFYLVFQNGKKNRYKESELVPYIDKEEGIIFKLQRSDYANSDSFQRYAYYHLFAESQEGNLYSYQGNKIIFNPFQYKPVMKFIGVDSDERLLVADEVGVGKTIESGIILDELISRGDLKNNDAIMIVCPSILCKKWRNELKSKFQMDDFYIHDGKSLTFMLSEIKDSGKIQYSHSIVSEQLFRGEKYQELLKACLDERGEAFFQMLIVDECHHYRNPGTNTHQFGELLSICSERVVMLSATPFNLKSDDLYNQLHMLNPVLFPDVMVFNHLIRQVRSVNKAASLIKAEGRENELLPFLDEIKSAAMSNEFLATDFEYFYDMVKKAEPLTVKDRVDLEKIINKLNPIASSFTRTLKRDAIEHRVTREAMTLEVHYTQEEEDVYDSFLETNLMRYKMLGISERAFGLILNGLERIAASSIVALQKNINHFIHLSDEEFAEQISVDGEIDKKSVVTMKKMLQDSYKELMVKIERVGDNDSKYSTLKQLIEKAQKASGDNKRIIIFSFYTETLKYLRRRLKADGYSIALMYGKTPEETPNNQTDEDGYKVIGRADIMRDFEEGKYEILLVSEVGGEGLDFQFCSSLINYDLPYNPMRIEQRIGRIDRMGQQADKIIIGNLCIANTIDMVINKVLLTRIDDAADLVGELEVIIAQEMEEINQLIITKEFTEEALHQREKEIELRIEKAKQTREEFDTTRHELVNDKGFRDEFEVSVKKSRISPYESLLFTYSFLKKVNGCWCKLIDDSAGTIHVSKDICEKVKNYNRRMNFGKAGEELVRLVDNEGDLEIDFDGNKAYENPKRVFFKPVGAWIHFVIDYIKALGADTIENVFYISAKNKDIDNINKGRYWLFIYEMEFKGFYQTKLFEYVLAKVDGTMVRCLTEDEKKKLMRHASNSKQPENLNYDNYDTVRMEADDIAEQRKEEIAADVMSTNNMKIGFRIQAIKSLSEIRIHKKENELIGATSKEEERIRKAIEREKKKTADKISILEDKLKFVGTYSFDAFSVVDIV